ncbi:nucleotide exchange factor GrpE [Robiginitalea marina]|uniref:Protein GrpE n=1 Tax=Robiginitalea marina TaxID=2954105 RepID=A0ABT1AXZ0_9FLAO|nr:nucleotide exchange factor GrpE [Robiginitalea marina]MCO5724078.1 nucleotide exchange factor GrpE [Robiginitalea marina]
MSTTNDTDEMEDLTRQEEGSRGEAPKRDTEDQGQQDSEGELREALEKEKDKFLRLFAEFENYKKRTTRERLELFKTAGQELMTALLPVLDDFDRAIRELERAGEDELLKGVVLIHNKFRDTLRAKGLEPIEARVGDAFDADLHEAVTQVPAPKKSLKGKVIDVIEKGYKLGDRVIRHPKVVVGN